MTELEIGRTLGPSSYYIYSVYKNENWFTIRDVEITTGLSHTCVETNVKKLLETGLLTRRKQSYGVPRAFEYKVDKV